MEKLKTLKIIVWMCVAILAVQLGLLLLMIRPGSNFIWIGFGVIIILSLYLARISLGLIAELGKKERQIEELEKLQKLQKLQKQNKP